MVWSHGRAHEREDTGGDSDDSDTDSEEEGGYDSDVEKEKNLTYEDKIYANPIRTTKGVKPHLRDRQEDEEHRYIIIVYYLALCPVRRAICLPVSPLRTFSTLLIQAVCRTRVTYEPSNSAVEHQTCNSEGHGFESLSGARILSL